MNKIVKIALASTLLLSVGTTTLSADKDKGQKLYMKKLKKDCKVGGAGMAAKHTQGEWKAIQDAGKMATEIQTICPGVKDKAIKAKYLDHYYDFFFEYGSDSGNVPSC